MTAVTEITRFDWVKKDGNWHWCAEVTRWVPDPFEEGKMLGRSYGPYTPEALEAEHGLKLSDVLDAVTASAILEADKARAELAEKSGAFEREISELERKKEVLAEPSS